MKHYKDFIIKLQTLDIKTKLVEDENQRESSIYTISHESPYLSSTFRNELKELKELAQIDILNIPKEQSQVQIQKLSELKERFKKFWYNLTHSYVPRGEEHLTELLYTLHLSELFIVPELSFQDHATADDYFMDDLKDSIRARQKVLEEFEQSVLAVIQPTKAPEKINSIKPLRSDEPRPVFKEGVADNFYALVKDYFKPGDQLYLKQVLTTETEIDHPLVFNSNGNQLADAFKQLFEASLIVGCNKTQLINWIINHFAYNDKGVVKNYSEKYLLDIISSNTKTCQSPILDIRKKDGQFVISPLQRNNRNNKT